MKHPAHPILSILALIAVGGAGCGGTTTTAGYTYYDPYTYYSYYPADVYYSGYYWTDPYSTYYYSAITAAAVVGGDAGVAADAGGGILRSLSVGDTIRALALGQDVCPNQVTVTPKTGPNLCASNGAPATIRNGVTIVFNGCALDNGGRLDGTYDVQATRTASDTACNASTTITISNTTTITNLAYTGPGGRKLVIPNQTGTSTLSYALGQPPTSSQVNLNGQAQIFAANGAILTDNKFSGTSTVTQRNDKTSYTTDSDLTLQDQLSASTTKLTTTGLVRSSDCCHPTGGKLTIDRSGANNVGTHTVTFGPACGNVTFDNSGVTLGATCL